MSSLGKTYDALTLCSLPKDIVRKIIRINGDGMELMRTISPAWKELVVECKCQKARIRSTYPTVSLAIEEIRGQVQVELRGDFKDQAYFEHHGFPPLPASGPTTFLESKVGVHRGYILLVFTFIHLLIVPFLRDIFVIFCTVILALCLAKIGNDEEVFRPLEPVLNIISKIDGLILTTLSEHTLGRVRTLTRNERIDFVSFEVDDFNEEQRKNLLEIINYHSVKEVEIVAEKCEIVGLRSFLCDLSATVSVLYIEERKNGFNDSSTMFGRDWKFWRGVSANLLSCGMLSVTMTCGGTEKKYVEPVFEFMTLFEGIKK